MNKYIEIKNFSGEIVKRIDVTDNSDSLTNRIYDGILFSLDIEEFFAVIIESLTKLEKI